MTPREKAANQFVEQSEYDSETSREMFLAGWDACMKLTKEREQRYEKRLYECAEQYAELEEKLKVKD